MHLYQVVIKCIFIKIFMFVGPNYREKRLNFRKNLGHSVNIKNPKALMVLFQVIFGLWLP